MPTLHRQSLLYVGRYNGETSLLFQAIAEGLEKPWKSCWAADPADPDPSSWVNNLVQPQPIPDPREVSHTQGWSHPHYPTAALLLAEAVGQE